MIKILFHRIFVDLINIGKDHFIYIKILALLHLCYPYFHSFLRILLRLLPLCLHLQLNGIVIMIFGLSIHPINRLKLLLITESYGLSQIIIYLEHLKPPQF